MNIGEYVNVPCLIRESRQVLDEQELWMDLDAPKRKLEYVPIFDHSHNDIENGQKESHYHRDQRYKHHDSDLFIRVDDIRPEMKHYDFIATLSLKVSQLEYYKTPLGAISKSKLKHKCIHKGKCPHRGYDLSNEKPVDGVITCPLHSLKFNSKTKLIITI